MSKPFYEQPVLNSPYHVPSRHHALDAEGRPLDQPPLEGRRRCGYVAPVPKARKQRQRGAQASLDLGADKDTAGQEYAIAQIVDEIRQHLASWRAIPNPNDWGVTPSTQRLLTHWRNPPEEALRPFFCQVEAAETIIWLTEVARTRRQYAHIWKHFEAANGEANPELFRLAMKMATGSGKTTVMAMLIAWHTVNAVRSPNSSHFSKGFLIVTPGITIRDRLFVLLPSDPNNYYGTRHLVPHDMLPEIAKARIVITNYHAFGRRRRLDTNKTGEALLAGWRNEDLIIEETEGEMLQRACGDLLTMKNVVVINDEAHHCYRERVSEDDEKLTAEDRQEAKDNNEAARLWISGIEALKRKVGLRALYDLSATPFFLRGSGYDEGTLFPWVVSDFALIDAIECGIVKLPRVPVSDNAVNADTPVFRNLWDHIGKRMPKKGAAKAGELDPRQIPNELQTALNALYSHYETEHEDWKRAGIAVPPVFIVVCNNTATSKLVYEWISGWEREVDGERRTIHHGHLRLFSNYDHLGNPLPLMNTLLIDSRQIESGEALDPNFRKLAESEIDQFRREKAQREGAAAVEAVSDSELLREVMNTVGKEGRLGGQIRCVVSVSMLTEGWDANTVTHILGVRAFGTQLLCEQVIGRALRRLSYDPGEQRDPQGRPLLDAEYADILGIPFDFATEPVKPDRTPPKPVTQVFAVRERAHLAIRFPRVAGYRTELPEERFDARFTDDSRFTIDPGEVGPSKARLEGVVGEGHDISPDILDEMRPATIAMHLSKRLVERYFRDGEAMPPYHLVGKLQPIVRRWIGECVTLSGGTKLGMLTYAEVADKAAALIHAAIARHAGERGATVIKAILDPFNPAGSTDHVRFITSKKTLWQTAPDKSHVNYVVCDSDWEAEFARVVEQHPATICYVKNQALGFEVPWRDGATPRRYLPDFLVRIDDGRGADDPLTLVVEIKGEKDATTQIKAETMRTLWVPGVNNLKTYGRWDFVEFSDVFAIEEAYAKLVQSLCDKAKELEVA
ncbi:DEAD/DEAH box helicase family protein [Xanthobacteraceae bacterium Astr-EGSB]|uniref:BPTD_3080 family restriction endonuclease n=1 Tax=Astrobacterium formosum TaxID=3069710 RepID=UPI0027B5E120|nr:DEAD/DEAH box helicase family protein [Xanthobacteraceae bacterium Astr-EGSB]